MKEIYLEDEGVASAVGTIFAILIFVSILSIFVTTYVPATMMSDEEQYSSGLMNSMIQLASAINQMTLNYKQGETSLISFNLESSYVPVFSAPTLGYVNITGVGTTTEGYFSLTLGTNSSPITQVGGAVMAISNNRYFVDEVWSYEFSSMMYNEYGTNNGGNSSLVSNLIQFGPSTNQKILNLTFNLVNIVGGPFTISTSSPFALTAEILSKQIFTETTSALSIRLASNSLQSAVFTIIKNSLPSNFGGSGSLTSTSVNNIENIKFSPTGGYTLDVTISEVTVFVGYSTLIQ